MKMMARGILKYVTANWYERLIFIFVSVILWNIISVFEGFWWDETYAVAHYTIFWAVLIDLLLPYRNRVGKLLLQVFAAILTTVEFARMDWLVVRPASWQDWLWWFQVHVVQLHPFIWVSAALLALYVLFAVWTVTRPRIFGLIGVSILSLTIADSFTPIWLWDEVAMVVFVGLLWLAAAHMAKLQREHPSSWKELIEYPIRFLMPIALVLSVLMTIGLSMPSLSPILQDPYTIWKESKGEKVEVFLGDKGLDALTLGNKGVATSGYSRSDDTLGGGFEYDYSPMMTVSTSQRSYWRGESKSFYTGDGWIDGAENQFDTESTYGVEYGVEFASLDKPPIAGTLQINQIVTMVRKDVYPVLFAAAPASKLNWVGSEEADRRTDLAWVANSWELRLMNWSMKNKKYPEAYSVTSMVPVLDEAELRKTKAGWSDAADAARNEYYLQLPDSVPARVKDLALQVTAEGKNDYDKARMLEQYLRFNYVYNNKPDESKIKDKSLDFVDKFLFEVKEGYCDYFSTTMAVMARSLGLPSRWVKGFAPGVLPASSYGPPGGGYMSEEDLNPTGAGTYTVRNSDAHSWVEIYFEGFGWIPFEATAGFAFPYTYAQEEQAALPESSLDDSGAAVPDKTESQLNLKVWAWSSVALLVALAAVWLFIRREKIIYSWRKLRHGSYTSNDRIVLETHKLIRVCKKRGMERQDHETMREAVLRWSLSQKRLREDFRSVLDGFEQAKYSPVIASSEDADRFAAKIRSLIDQLK